MVSAAFRERVSAILKGLSVACGAGTSRWPWNGYARPASRLILVACRCTSRFDTRAQNREISQSGLVRIAAITTDNLHFGALQPQGITVACGSNALRSGHRTVEPAAVTVTAWVLMPTAASARKSGDITGRAVRACGSCPNGPQGNGALEVLDRQRYQMALGRWKWWSGDGSQFAEYGPICRRDLDPEFRRSHPAVCRMRRRIRVGHLEVWITSTILNPVQWRPIWDCCQRISDCDPYRIPAA